MQIDEAIHLLQQDLDDPVSVDISELNKAEELGIEALKEVICLRSTYRTVVRPLLPGETRKGG